MKAIVLNFSLTKATITLALSKIYRGAVYSPLSMLSYHSDYPEPQLLGDEWERIETVMCGICGSDIRLITLKESLYLFPLTSFPMIPGHEVVGIVERVGEDFPFERGERVVIDPALPCKVRGFSDCPACRAGSFAACHNLDRGKISPGLFTGFCRDVGGGWSELFLAHSFQVFRVPDEVDDRNAVFAEPLSVAIHAAGKIVGNAENIAVIGCGSIGLCVIAALRELGFRGDIVAIDVSRNQLKLAEKFGATHTLRGGVDDVLEQVAELTGGRVYTPPGERKMFVDGGFDAVFECVGNADTVDEAMRIVKPLGRVVVLGTAAKLSVDWAPVYAKEVRLVGSFGCGVENIGGRKVRTFELALEILKNLDLSVLLTHTFKIEEYRKALWTAMNKSKTRAVKVAFEF